MEYEDLIRFQNLINKVKGLINSYYIALDKYIDEFKKQDGYERKINEQINIVKKSYHKSQIDSKQTFKFYKNIFMDKITVKYDISSYNKFHFSSFQQEKLLRYSSQTIKLMMINDYFFNSVGNIYDRSLLKYIYFQTKNFRLKLKDVLVYHIIDFDKFKWYFRVDYDNCYAWFVRLDHIGIPNLIIRNYNLKQFYCKGDKFNKINQLKSNDRFINENLGKVLITRTGNQDNKIVFTNEIHAFEFDVYINQFNNELSYDALFKMKTLMDVTFFDCNKLYHLYMNFLQYQANKKNKNMIADQSEDMQQNSLNKANSNSIKQMNITTEQRRKIHDRKDKLFLDFKEIGLDDQTVLEYYKQLKNLRHIDYVNQKLELHELPCTSITYYERDDRPIDLYDVRKHNQLKNWAQRIDWSESSWDDMFGGANIPFKFKNENLRLVAKTSNFSMKSLPGLVRTIEKNTNGNTIWFHSTVYQINEACLDYYTMSHEDTVVNTNSITLDLKKFKNEQQNNISNSQWSFVNNIQNKLPAQTQQQELLNVILTSYNVHVSYNSSTIKFQSDPYSSLFSKKFVNKQGDDGYQLSYNWECLIYDLQIEPNDSVNQCVRNKTIADLILYIRKYIQQGYDIKKLIFSLDNIIFHKYTLCSLIQLASLHKTIQINLIKRQNNQMDVDQYFMEYYKDSYNNQIEYQYFKQVFLNNSMFCKPTLFNNHFVNLNCKSDESSCMKFWFINQEQNDQFVNLSTKYKNIFITNGNDEYDIRLQGILNTISLIIIQNHTFTHLILQDYKNINYEKIIWDYYYDNLQKKVISWNESETRFEYNYYDNNDSQTQE